MPEKMTPSVSHHNKSNMRKGNSESSASLSLMISLKFCFPSTYVYMYTHKIETAIKWGYDIEQ